MNSVKSIRLNRESQKVDCFDGTTILCSIHGTSIYVNSDDELVNFIKQQGSIELAIEYIKTLSQQKRKQDGQANHWRQQQH